MKRKRYTKAPGAKDARTNGRIILALGEVTGHHHEVVAGATTDDALMPAAEFFEEPNGRRVLLVTRRCQLTHQEHGTIALDPNHPEQVRQGDVLLNPIGKGAWEVIRQSEYDAQRARQVAD